MLSLKAHLLILVGFVAALIAVIAGAGVLQASGMKELPPGWRVPSLGLLVGLVAAIGFSAIPVMVKLVLGFQRAVGNAEVGPVKAVLALETALIWGIWGLMAAGMALAIPAAIVGGMFKEKASTATAISAPGPSQGVLTARPGMTLAEMARASTLKLDIVSRYGGRPAPVVAGGDVFDFRIPGSSIVFRGCRYYYVSTFTHDPGHIEAISIGVSPRKLTRAELDRAEQGVRAELAADGWRAGHEVYRDEEDRTLHGGLTQGPEGRTWLKDEVVLDVESKRMDEAAPGEDAAGEWIQYIELRSKADYPWIERYEFAPYHGGADSTASTTR